MTSPPPWTSPLLPLHEWACLRTELIWIYDRAVPPRHRHWSGKPEPMPGYRAWLIRRGTVTIATTTRTVTAGAGKWVAPARGASETTFSPDAHILSIHFHCQWPSGEGVLEGNDGLVLDGKRHPALERLARELHSHLQTQFPALPEDEHIYSGQSSRYDDFLAVQGVFLAWLARWFRGQVENGARVTRLASGDSRPSRAARCLNAAPLHQGFPEARLHQETRLGLMRLNQLFFAEFGLTTRKYWDRRRLDFAKQCLETSRMPMKEIAFALGFRSDSHFVVWFRRLTGTRPGDHRKSRLPRAT